MTNEQSELIAGEDTQAGISRSHEQYQPVIVTDTVGALFLGVMSIILMAVVGGLLIRNHKLEDRLRKFGHSMDH